MTFYTPLERLANSAKACSWDVKADPAVVLRLIEIAKAAEVGAPAWEFTGIGGLKPYLTQKQYEAQTAGTRRWYRPACRCRAALGTQPAKEKNDA